MLAAYTAIVLVSTVVNLLCVRALRQEDLINERIHRGTMKPHGRLDEDSFAGHVYEVDVQTKTIGTITLTAGVAAYSVDGYGNDIYALNEVDTRQRGKEF